MRFALVLVYVALSDLHPGDVLACQAAALGRADAIGKRHGV
jgi:hypothetical protein